MQIARKASNRGGKVMLCTAISSTGAGPLAVERLDYWRERMIFELEGERLSTGAQFAAIHNFENTVIGKTANCVVTEIEWRPSFDRSKVEIRLPSSYVKA